jgi:hypothetical protein
MNDDLKLKPGETKKEMGLRMVFVQKLLELMTAAFLLVAALAWNDAIQSLFLRVFGSTNGVIAKFVYALIITVLVVLVIFRLSKLTQRIEKNSIKSI